MQSKDINVGGVYRTTRAHAVLIIDKGKYSVTHSSEQSRIVHYKTLSVDVGKNWYFSNPGAKSRIIGVNLNNSQVLDMNGAAIKEAVPEDKVNDLLLRESVNKTMRDKTRELNERKAAFQQTLVHLFADLTHTSEVTNYREDQQPYLVLMRNQSFVMGMLSLWLKFEQTQGRTVGTSQSEPMDVLVDLADALQGISATTEQFKELDANAVANAQAELNKHPHGAFAVEVL